MDDKYVSREKLEEQMDEHLVNKAPFQIPEPGRQLIVTWAPWFALISGVFSLISVIGLWSRADEIGDVTRTYFGADGELVQVSNSVGVFYYLAMLALLAQAILMLSAFSGLQSRSKTRGWNILLYGIFASMVYNIFFGLSSQGETGNFVLAFLTGLIGLYFLAQTKSYFHAEKEVSLSKAKKPKTISKKSAKKSSK